MMRAPRAGEERRRGRPGEGGGVRHLVRAFVNERARVLGLVLGAAEGDCEGFARLCRGSGWDRRAWARGESALLLGLGRGGAL